MAQSLLGLKNRGTGFPAAFRVIGGGSPIQIGATFLTQLFTAAATTIAVASNGVSLPTGTINVASTTGFPTAGKIRVVTGSGTQTVTYSGTSGGNQFTGCTGGVGAMATGGAVSLVLFTAGETVSHSSGAQTAIVTQVFSDHLVLNTMSASWGPSTGTITGGTSGATALGAGVEGLEHNGTSGSRRAACRVIQAANQLFAFQYNTIYKYDQANSVWKEAYRRTNLAAADAAAESNSKTGIYSIEVSGIVNLATMFYVSSGTAGIYRIISADNGATWSELRVSTNVWPTSGSPLALVYQNVFYVNEDSHTGHDSWNPATDGYARVANAASLDVVSNRMVVWQGRLFMCHRNGVADFQLSEFTGGSYTSRYSGGGGHVADNAGQVGAFVAPDGNLRVFAQHYSSDDLYVFKFTTGFSFSDVTSGVSPGGNNQRRVECYVDQEVNCLAGGPIIPFIWIAADDTAGTSRAYYEYTDDSTALVQISSGCPVEVALPNDSHGTGERSWFPGELDVQPSTVPLPVIGGQKIYVKVYKQPGTADVTGVKLRLLYGQTGEVPRNFGTLSNPVASPPGPTLAVSGGNEITGIVADGTTEYSFDWLAISSDGLVNFTQTQFAPVVHK